MDYQQALESHYNNGPCFGWQDSFVSAYASAHPWEDFAETWAHYIHMLDTLETASGSGIALKGRRIETPLPLARAQSFAGILDDWLPLTVVLNQLSRSMGLRDAYPFALPDSAIRKLAFVHELCLEAGVGSATRSHAGSGLAPQRAPSLR